jgi:integrase
MGVDLIDGSLTVSSDVSRANKIKIGQLNVGTFFSNKSMNKHGKVLVKYLCNSSYLGLSNPEPVDLRQNSLSKVLSRLKVIDTYVQKPLEEYTEQDMNNFISDFKHGKLKSTGKRQYNPDSVVDYVREFKRFWKVFRQYTIRHETGFDPLKFEWGLNLKAPKVESRRYEKFPVLEVQQLIDFANGLNNEEYMVRTLLSVNLMGRVCEVSQLKYKHVQLKKGNEVWIELPKVKKHSTEKVPVELFTFVKKPFLKYLEHHEFREEDLLFPSNVPAFAKKLREVSQAMFRARINPKTLRKLGVCIAEKLSYSRSEVERIGGWRANSPVINHYFSRKGVPVKRAEDKKLQEVLHKDIYVEFDQVKAENKMLKKRLDEIDNRLGRIISKEVGARHKLTE